MSARSRRFRKTSLAGRLFGGAARALIDLVDNGRGSDGERRRRLPPVETQAPDAIVTQRKRALVAAAARGEVANNADAASCERALRVHVVGDRGKPFFRGAGDEPWFDEAERFFKAWSRHADFVTGRSWRECLQGVVASVAFEGDVVAVFDDGLLTGGAGSGRFAFFGPDRICPLAAADFDAWKATNGRTGWTQCAGVLFDDFGRRAGVVVSRLRGAAETKIDEAFVLVLDPLDPDAAPWIHVSRPRRFDQVRAVPDAAAALPAFIDAKEVREAHSGTVKVSASRHGVLKHDFSNDPDPRDLEDIEDEADGGETGGGDDAADAAETAEGAAQPADAGKKPIPSFKGLSDVQRGDSVGAIDVIDKEDDFVVTPQVTPNPNIVPYLEDEVRYAARALGFPALLATLRADHSYSGARAELALAEKRFEDLRQHLEDSFSDWAAVQVFRWAMRTGRLSADAPEGWEESLAWEYPRLPYLDPMKEAQSAVALYRAGLASMEDLGVRPKERAAAMSDDAAIFQSFGVTNCSLFEAAPGAQNGIAGGGEPTDDDDNPKPTDEP